MFIVFEGVDGTGKSTQLDQCKTWIEEWDRNVTVCRDPGSTELGIRLREILLDRSELKIDFTAEMFMFMSARAQMVAEIILPALQRKDVVLCDRFLLSTVVYQGHAGHLDPGVIWEIGNTATQDCKPDLTLVFDAPLTITMKRIGTQLDRMESRGEEYFSEVRRGFLAEAALDESIEVIDASGPPQEIHLLARKAIEPILQQMSGTA